MALDGAFLYAVKQELDVLIGGRIDKIYQPSVKKLLYLYAQDRADLNS